VGSVTDHKALSREAAETIRADNENHGPLVPPLVPSGAVARGLGGLSLLLRAAGRDPQEDGRALVAVCPSCGSAGRTLRVERNGGERLHASCSTGCAEGDLLAALDRIGTPESDTRPDPPGRSGGSRLFVPASEIEPQDIAWLWEGRIARAGVTLLVGDPAAGKSTLSCEIAARISRGQELPGGPPSEGPATVGMVNVEDPDAQVIIPRLIAAGADRGRVEIYQPGDDPLTLPSAVAPLAEWCRRVRPALVILDPITALLDGGLNSWRDVDVRRALRPLASLAEEVDVAILALAHPPKGQGNGKTAGYIAGSYAWTAAARSALFVGRPPDAEEGTPERLLVQGKPSWTGEDLPAVGFTISRSRDINAPCVGWRGETGTVAVSALLAPPASTDDRTQGLDAEEAIVDALTGGSLTSAELWKRVQDRGAAKNPYEAARARLRRQGVIDYRQPGREGERGGQAVEWFLVDESAQPIRSHEIRSPEGMGPNSGGPNHPFSHAGSRDATDSVPLSSGESGDRIGTSAQTPTDPSAVDWRAELPDEEAS